MKKYLLFTILLCLQVTGYSQTVTGTVFDKETRKPVSYAVIYFEGTSVAALTDSKGNFNLDVKKIASMPLTVSAMGYYSLSISDYSTGKPLILYLIPKLIELNEISVEAKSHPGLRKKNLKIFRTEFLGRTENSKHCEILNEGDLRFVTSGDNDTLRAYSLKPLIIDNKALGYRITYYLDKFEFIKSQSVNQLIGDFLFEKDTVHSHSDSMIELRRNYAYFGSKMHFFRSLWQNDIEANGFVIADQDRILNEKELVRYQMHVDPADAEKYIYYNDRVPAILTVEYKPSGSASVLEILHNNILFTRDGYFKGHNIIWQGEMALTGIADQLPYDFKPTCEARKLFVKKLYVPLYTKVR